MCPLEGYSSKICRVDHTVAGNYYLELHLKIIILFLKNFLLPMENKVICCFKIIWKSKGSHFNMCLILNLSLHGVIADAGRFILFPFKVILTSFQSISMTSHNIFPFDFTCLGINFPLILNKCMLPAVLHSFTGM